MLPKSCVTNLRDFLDFYLNVLYLILFIFILGLHLFLQPIFNTPQVFYLAFCLNFCFFKVSALESPKSHGHI